MEIYEGIAPSTAVTRQRSAALFLIFIELLKLIIVINNQKNNSISWCHVSTEIEKILVLFQFLFKKFIGQICLECFKKTTKVADQKIDF